MGPPILIGAGLGAITSAAMGKSPFTGALLGGATGGMFGGAGGFGSGFTQGGGLLSSVAPATTGAGVQLGSTAANLADDVALNAVDDVAFNQAFNTALPTNIASGGGAGIKISPYLNVADDGLGFAASGAPSTGIPLSFGEVNPFALDPRRMVVDTPLTFGERISDLGSSGYSYLKDNPATALGGVNSLSNASNQAEQAKQQRLNEAVATGAQPIQRKQFDPSSAIAAAPSYGLSREEVGKGKIGQIASQARLNDEDERRIGQFYQSLIG
jgi:hypothetical protein